MISRGLLVRLKAKPGKARALEEFLTNALPAVRAEAGTIAWFGVRLSPQEYGTVDVFPDDAARYAHLQGPVAQALMNSAPDLLSRAPKIQNLDVLAFKLPTDGGGAVSRGVLLHFKPRRDQKEHVEQFLRDAQSLVEVERGTTAWFAVRIDNDEYGIFDVFPDRRGQLKHLTGQVPRKLAKHATTLLGGVPRMRLMKVFAEKLEPVSV